MSTQAIAIPKKGTVQPQSITYPGSVSAIRVANTAMHTNGNSLVRLVTGVANGNHRSMIEQIREGLPIEAIKLLEGAFNATRAEIAACLSIPVATLTRRLREGRLHADESDRVVRLARIKDAALMMMQGDDDAAVEWLHTPLAILGDETPMAHANTELGARDVEDLIGRIRHGVFS